jgi:hypothetical protein
MKFVGREHKHKDDCWCDALSLALGKPYDDIYNALSLFEKDGMAHDISRGILLDAGYIAKNMESEQMSVEFLLDIVNHYDNEVVVATEEHIFYVHKNKIHDLKELKYSDKFMSDLVYIVFLRNLNFKWTKELVR